MAQAPVPVPVPVQGLAQGLVPELVQAQALATDRALAMGRAQDLVQGWVRDLELELDLVRVPGQDRDWAQDWVMVMAKAPDQSRPANHPIHRRPHWGRRALRAAVVALAQSRPVGVVAR